MEMVLVFSGRGLCLPSKILETKDDEGNRLAGASPGQITEFLLCWSQGDDHALDKLTPLVYNDLRRLAFHFLRSERQGHTLQPTALVNEAYLKLAKQKKLPWQNRAHFYAVAARVMRQILVDYARSHRRQKRGGGASALPLDEALVFVPEKSAELLALDQALERLKALDPRKSRVVELRFFGGLDNRQTAEILNISANTVMRDWNMAKTWLRREMNAGERHDRDTMGES
jgi:RNA polymerase sigma factor (TIGR02999 family)